MTIVRRWVLLLIGCGALFSQTGSVSTGGEGLGLNQDLPVRKVALFKNGVGYFEHLGEVSGRREVGITFTSGQLNDVLKSLTILDLNGGRIAGVSYGTQDSVERQMGDLRLSASENGSLTDILAALRGARIEIRSVTAASLTGRLLSVERKTRATGGNTLEVDYVSLLTDSGDLRTTEVSPTFTVRLLEPNLAGKVQRYLDLISRDREPDQRQMTIIAEGDGTRSLFVSYISEVPVWKSTYRLVFEDRASVEPLLQGWAIVDNTVGQDWNDVALSLVAGAPQSFIQNLSLPVYSRRPVVEISSSALSTPQTYETMLRRGRARVIGKVHDGAGGVMPGVLVKAFDHTGAEVGQARSGESGEYELNDLPDGAIRLEAEALGFQRYTAEGLVALSSRPLQHDVALKIGMVTETVVAKVSSLQTNTSSRRIARSGSATLPTVELSSGTGQATATSLYARMAATIAPVATRDLGDLFEYNLRDRITIPRGQSALVPTVSTSIPAERVTIWNDSAEDPRPMRGLWLNNTTGLTLDGGSFSVLEENTFAGEGLIEALRPGERRLISYATDLAVTVSSGSKPLSDRVSRVRIANGVLTVDSELHEQRTYTLRNQDTHPRTVIVEHPVREGFRHLGTTKPEEESNQWMRFRVTLDPRQTKSFTVEESLQQPRTYAISNLDSNVVGLFVQQRSISQPLETALRQVLDRQRDIAMKESLVDTLAAEYNRIVSDQERLRDNMQALRGASEERTLRQRYVRQMNEQEDSLERLAAEITKAEEAAIQASADLDLFIAGLNFDEGS